MKNKEKSFLATQKIRILADATMDLSPEIVEELNIGILPTQIIFSDRDKPYRNYIDITAEEFFDKLLASNDIPTTSIPRQGDILKAYEDSLKDYETLIVLAHSQKISSSYVIAKKVADMFPDNDITVIDTQTITIMEGLLVYEAAKMAQKGATKEAIISRINELIPHTHGIAILKSLDYLRKGGRISIAKHIIANLANFRPIIAVEDGLVQNIGKVKGIDKGIELIINLLPEILMDQKTDTIFILHALMPEEAERIKKAILAQKVNVPKNIIVELLGPVLGTHMGPYCIGIGWIGNWDKKWFS
ncbi:MAG: DegV family protein [Asgard group archaeon]|nr:DegV family protein [Asgard group archaeon]